MWNKELPNILPKRQFGGREPSAMQWEKLICDVWQFVIPFYRWTSTLARRHIVKQPVVQVQCPAIDDQDCSDAILAANLTERLAFGKLFCPWWNREEFKATLSLWFIRPQTNPCHSVEPNQQLIATFCALIRWCFLSRQGKNKPGNPKQHETMKIRKTHVC